MYQCKAGFGRLHPSAPSHFRWRLATLFCLVQGAQLLPPFAVRQEIRVIAHLINATDTTALRQGTDVGIIDARDDRIREAMQRDDLERSPEEWTHRRRQRIGDPELRM